jgi:hypothetical protein
MPGKVSRRFEITLAVCVVLIAAIVAWQVAVASKRPLDSKNMEIDVADLGSYAAEGELLARQRIGATVTRSYSKVQSEMWRDKIEEIVRKYQSREPAANLTKSFEEVGALAQRLLSAADALMDTHPKEGTSGELASNLKQVESDARELKSRLAGTSD